MTNYTYLKSIVDQVNQLNIANPSYKDEIIDHYATLYEHLNNTMTSDQALEKVLYRIQNDNFQPPKSKNMNTYLFTSTILLAILSLAFSFNFFNSNQQNAPLQKDLLVEESVDITIDPPYGNPLKNIEVVSGYGNRKHPIYKVMKLHSGIDLKAPLGTPVYAVENGVVVDCGYHKKYGYFVEIKHDEKFSTRFHHLQKTYVEKGQNIEKNQEIGAVGSSGMSTGPHLHYEIIESGQKVDPKQYLRA